MRPGRTPRPGDEALTDYNGPGPLTRVRIVERDDTRTHGHSQSGILLRVSPPLKHGTATTWYDADWFEPIDDIIDVLSHILAEADGWHDEARGGPIEGDATIDRVRAILVADGRRPYPGVEPIPQQVLQLKA